MVVSGIAGRWADASGFVVREDGVAEGILAVTLLEHALVGDSLGCEKAKGVVAKDGSVALGFGEQSVLVVAKDDDARLGTMGFAVAVGLDREDTHGRDSFG